MDFVDAKTIFLIAHLIGIAFGVGGALISDILFIKSMRDGKISRTEMDFLITASGCVTFGLLLLIASGAGMFSLNPEGYMESAKFMTKMAVVAILSVNGIIFHVIHIPLLKLWSRGKISFSAFKSKRVWLVISGVVSLVSWLSALILGAFKSVPLSFELLFSLYLAALAVGVFVGIILLDRLVPKPTKESQ